MGEKMGHERTPNLNKFIIIIISGTWMGHENVRKTFDVNVTTINNHCNAGWNRGHEGTRNLNIIIISIICGTWTGHENIWT